MTDFEKKVLALIHNGNKNLLKEIKKLNSSIQTLNESLTRIPSAQGTRVPQKRETEQLNERFKRNAGLTNNDGPQSSVYNFIKNNVVTEEHSNAGIPDDMLDEDIDTRSILDYAAPDNLIGKMLNKDYKQVVESMNK